MKVRSREGRKTTLRSREGRKDDFQIWGREKRRVSDPGKGEKTSFGSREGRETRCKSRKGRQDEFQT
jgi:hypothetical protein